MQNRILLVADDQAIADAHGAALSLESAPGQGTTFRIRLRQKNLWHKQRSRSTG